MHVWIYIYIFIFVCINQTDRYTIFSLNTDDLTTVYKSISLCSTMYVCMYVCMYYVCMHMYVRHTPIFDVVFWYSMYVCL